MAPFLPYFPMMEEYRFIFLHHCIGSTIFSVIGKYNFSNPIFLEHFALSLYLSHHYFKVGDIAEATNQIRLMSLDNDTFRVRAKLQVKEHRLLFLDLRCRRAAFKPSCIVCTEGMRFVCNDSSHPIGSHSRPRGAWGR